VSALKDCGADIDMVTQSLVDELMKHSLVKPFKLDIPIRLGGVNTKHAFTITHAVTLPIREGDVYYEHSFGIAPMPTPPSLIMGRPWLKRFCPQALTIMQQFGIQHMPNSVNPIVALSSTYTPPLTPRTTPPSSPKLNPQTPIACPPCKDPAISYFAGGGSNLLAAIESEEYLRTQAQEKFAICLNTRIQVDHALQNKHLNAQVRASAAQGTNDPGVRGLTGNKEGWLDTIPPEFQHFANTIFSDEAAGELPPYRPDYDCTIKIREGEKLKASKLYDMSQEELTHLKALLDLELKRGFIRPSKSDSSAPVFFVRDPSSGTRSGQLRLVVDYRDLNSKIELDEYPIPLSRTLMNDLAGADWVTAMDVRSGFSNIRMSPGSEKATAFKTFYGLFEHVVMPMGLATAPSIFQRFINSVLNPYLGIFCHAYLDDVVIYTRGTLEKHKEHVRLILEALQENGLRLKPQKCKWFTKQCDFLGFTIVCGKGIRMADDKIQGIRDLKPPRHLSDLRSFLGIVGFYDKFIPHYSDTTACLTNLTKKDVPWNFDEKCHQAFKRILDSIREDIFIRAFIPGKPIRLSTDASDEAYAGAMEQEYQDGWHPFLLFHHKFHASEKGWDIHDKELFAIVHAFSHYRHFLAQSGNPVQVFTDHRNLAKFMFSTNLLKSHDGRLGRWWETLSQCNFQIQYLPGKENVLPDFLSRYGFDAAATLPERILLPSLRFSPKALADIESWFKRSSTSPNIRKLLEEKFAKQEQENQNSSPDPVQEPQPSPLEPSAKTPRKSPFNPFQENTWPANQAATRICPISGFPQTPDTASFVANTPPLQPLPRERLVTHTLSPRQSKLYKLINPHKYTGASSSLWQPTTNHRKPGDTRGLGA
jgi:Reverse transcriptase (RNA-dependent DNA polymerase)/RNase H-like domain found in reverse transcriptase